MFVKYYFIWYCIINCGNVMYISFYVDVIVKLVDIYIFWLKGKM